MCILPSTVDRPQVRRSITPSTARMTSSRCLAQKAGPAFEITLFTPVRIARAALGHHDCHNNLKTEQSSVKLQRGGL